MFYRSLSRSSQSDVCFDVLIDVFHTVQVQSFALLVIFLHLFHSIQLIEAYF